MRNKVAAAAAVALALVILRRHRDQAATAQRRDLAHVKFEVNLLEKQLELAQLEADAHEIAKAFAVAVLRKSSKIRKRRSRMRRGRSKSRSSSTIIKSTSTCIFLVGALAATSR